MSGDLQTAWRRIVRGRGTAIAIVGLLALAMAVVAGLFSVAHGLLWKPLPYPAESRLVQLTARSASMGIDLGWSVPYLAAVAQDSREFDTVAGYRRAEMSETDTEGRFVAALDVLHAEPSLLSLLGVQPLRGRLLETGDAVAGAEPVALLSAAFWQARYAGADSALGQRILVGGRAYRVAGILPESFGFPLRGTQVVLPLGFSAADRAIDQAGSFGSLRAIARLREGASAQAASAEMARIAGSEPTLAALAEQIALQLDARPLREIWLEGRAGSLQALLLAALLVYAVVLANAYNLFVLRLLRRRQEFAVQEAMGAPLSRRLRQVGLEAAILAGIAGALALALVAPGMALLGYFEVVPRDLPQAIGIDAATLLAIAAMWATAVLVLGSAALALRLRRTFEVLRQTGNGQTASGALHRLRKMLVAAQFVAAFVLLYATLLLARSAQQLLAEDLGFDRGGVVVATLQPASSLDAGPEQVRRQLAGLLRVLQASPGVQAAGLTSSAPFSRNVTLEAFQTAAASGTLEASAPKAYVAHVSEGMVPALGLRLLSGRNFSAAEAAARAPLVLIDEALAQRHFGAADPLGASLIVSDDGAPRRVSVVGVVAGIRQRVLQTGDQYPSLYLPDSLPYAVPGVPLESVELVVRSAQPAALREALPRLLRDASPSLRVSDALSMQERVADTIADALRLNQLLQILSVLTLLLTATGLYTLLAHAVAVRQREFGIRQAIGASAARLRRELLLQGARLLAVALAVGIPAALLLSLLLRSRLHQIGVIDPPSLGAAIVLLFGVGLAANLFPARRAAAVKPSEALRYD